MLKKALILSVFLAMAIVPSAAQYYQTGSAPASLSWRQIKGDHFDIIYPKGLDSLAREYLFSFERYRTATLTGLKIETPRMPMVLHPYDMYSNGMVVWAPRRLEIYTTPPGDALYAQDWITQLAVHEGRHVGQMTHYTKHAFRWLNILVGEQGSAVGIGLHPSRVLFEGDAVLNETDMTPAGRGRDPEFLKYFRAAFLAGDMRKYVDWRYGSFRRYSPGKYPLGYMTLRSMRDVSGNYFAAGDIIGSQSRNWWKLFNVSRNAYLEGTGYTGGENWWMAVASNTERWAREYEDRAPYTSTLPLQDGRDAVYTEITNPVPLGDRTYALMSGMQYERRIVSLDSLGQRHWERPFSYNTSTLVADGDHTLLFSEIVPDPRWEHRSWSVIRRYDAETNSIRTLTRRSRYLNPAPSAGRDSILAAEYPVTGGSNVVILDREGKLLDRIAAPENGQVTGVTQLHDALYASVITGKGMGLYRYDGDWNRVLAPQSRMIRSLQAMGDSLLYFVSDLDGLSNVYAFDPEENALRRLTSARFSATTPSFAGDTLYFGDYDHLGYLPVAALREDLDWKPASFDEPYVNEIAERNAAQAIPYVTMPGAVEDSLLRAHIDSLESRRFSKIGNSIHIHSWAPFYANIDRLMNDIGSFDLNHFSNWYEFIAPGATLVSQNKLGTLVGTLGYSYHAKHHAGHAHVSYSGLYPKFELSVDYNERDRIHTETFYGNGKTLSSIDTVGKPSLKVNAAMSVPLNLSRGGWVTKLIPQVNYVMTNDSYRYMQRGSDVREGSDITQLLIATLRFDTRFSRPAPRLTPRFGFGFQVSGQTRLGPSLHRNDVYAVNAWTYLPGFGKEDGFKLSYARQYQPEGALQLSTDYNMVRMPFGFSREILMNYHRGTLEYALPIYAGDIDGGFFFYLKRFILIPFVDYAWDKKHPVIVDAPVPGSPTREYIAGYQPSSFFSYGTALMVTTRLFRIGSDLQLGVRYSRRHLPGDWGRFQFVMSTGL